MTIATDQPSVVAGLDLSTVPVVILCGGDDTANNIGGLCQREISWGGGLTIVYAFRGGHLTAWDDLDNAVKTLVGAFQAPPAEP